MDQKVITERVITVAHVENAFGLQGIFSLQYHEWPLGKLAARLSSGPGALSKQTKLAVHANAANYADTLINLECAATFFGITTYQTKVRDYRIKVL